MGTPSNTSPPETVCRRVITGDPAYYPHVEYQGEVIYFCTEACLHAFLEDPERFLEVHVKEEE